MNKSWQDWVNENLQRGCNPSELADILLKNKFSLAQILKMMDGRLPEGFGKSEATEVIPTLRSGQESITGLQRKAASLFTIGRDLAHLTAKPPLIERRKGVPGQEFLEKYYSANRPVILCDLMAYWQAPQKWTPDYLLSVCGHETVEALDAHLPPPESSADEKVSRKQMKLSKFISGAEAKGKARTLYINAGNNFFSHPGAKPALKDIEPFTEYLKDTGNEGISLVYVPPGVKTILQHGLNNMLMAQVRNSVRVKLLPPSELESVYNAYSVYGRVDLYDPDYEIFPKLRNALVLDIELKAGEVLFLPVGWWYSLAAEDVSISVSFTGFLFPNQFQWEHPGN